MQTSKQEKAKEIVDSLTREDGCLEIGKYDHKGLESLFIEAMDWSSQQTLQRFDNEIYGYSMNIIGGHDGKSEDIIRPIMVVREDVRKFLLSLIQSKE